MSKYFISPSELRLNSFELAQKVVRSGFKPKFLVALWRGGAPIGCYVHEFLKYKGIHSDHIAIRTSRYQGIDQTMEEVIVHNLTYLKEQVKHGDSILLVDDVWDSGHSISAFMKKINELGDLQLDVRVATIHFKPQRNQIDSVPNYYVKMTDEWLVYPHELEGLSADEIREHFGPDIAKLLI